MGYMRNVHGEKENKEIVTLSNKYNDSDNSYNKDKNDDNEGWEQKRE